MTARFHEYPNGPAWLTLHPLDKSMIYASGRESQVLEMSGLGIDLGCEVRFPSYHTSKSVHLPVAAYLLAPGVVAYVRDNFHDVNVAVSSEQPLSIPLDRLYTEHTWTWYVDQVQRAEVYNAGRYDFRTTDWYSDWSGGSLKQEGVRLFRANRPFLQGIDGLLEFEDDASYREGAKVWAVAVSSLRPGDFGPKHLCALGVLRSVQAAAGGEQ